MVAMAFVAPERRGDAFEYLGIVEAFVNHASPDLRPEDIASLETVLTANDARMHPDILQSFPEGRGSRRLALHFFLYPMLAVPIRVALDAVVRTPGMPVMLLAFFASRSM